MAEYQLYCFAQSGNCYRAALMLNAIGADWERCTSISSKLVFPQRHKARRPAASREFDSAGA